MLDFKCVPLAGPRGASACATCLRPLLRTADRSPCIINNVLDEWKSANTSRDRSDHLLFTLSIVIAQHAVTPKR